MVMLASGAMNMGCRFLGRRCQLSGKHNPTGFMLLGQMFCNFGMECFDIADHAEGSLEQDWRSLALQRETFKQAGV